MQFLLPELRDCFYVDPDIKKARTLPRGAYWDSTVLDYEIEKVFRNSWILLPKSILDADQAQALQTRRHAVHFQFLGENYFLQRGSKPADYPIPICLSNVCPHAGYPLITQRIVDKGTSSFNVCGQHGLTTDREGKFVSHPAFSKDDPRTKQLCVQKYPLERWLDFLLLCPGKPVVSFGEVFEPMLESIVKIPIAQFRYMPNMDEERVVDGNWKLHAGNYMDSLHIRYIHHAPGGLQDAVWMESYRTECYPHSSLQWVYARNPEAGFEWKYMQDRFRDPKSSDRKVFALWWFVSPNITFNFYPWGLSINIYMPIPGDPAHIRFYWHHYVWDEEKYRLRDELWLSSQVDAEDVEAMAQLQKNMRPGGNAAQRGFFGDVETGPHWFHRWVYSRMFES